MKTKKIFIQGMHCVSCEELLDSEFRKIPDVANVKINLSDNSAEIYFQKKQPHISEFQKVGEKFSYKISEIRLSDPDKTYLIRDWLWSVSIVLVLIFAYKILQNLGFLKNINTSSRDISFGVAILAGVVASFSSCLAVVGAVIIAFAEKYQANGKDFYQTALKPNIQFHLGRLVTFFVLGGVLGLIGQEINISGNLVSIFTIVIAIIMAWLGLNILNILPPISSIGIKMPKSLMKNWHQLQKSEHKAAPYLLGGLTFFLPCGFTQSMQIFALVSGNFITGGVTLLLFALGTLPILLVIGATASWAKSKKIEIIKKIAGILIIIFAVSTFLTGYSLIGIKSNIISGVDNKITTSEDKAAPGEQIVEMHITSSGFSPNKLEIKKNLPVKWIIYGDEVSGCTNEIIIKSLGVRAKINPGENIIRFNAPDEAGILNFSCWMGMVRGKFIIK